MAGNGHFPKASQQPPISLPRKSGPNNSQRSPEMAMFLGPGSAQRFVTKISVLRENVRYCLLANRNRIFRSPLLPGNGRFSAIPKQPLTCWEISGFRQFGRCLSSETYSHSNLGFSQQLLICSKTNGVRGPQRPVSCYPTKAAGRIRRCQN